MSVINECRRELSEKFLTWLDRNRERIGEKWYKNLLKFFRKIKMNDETDVLAIALWMFNMIGNLGGIAGVGLFGYKLEKIYNLDEKTTEDVLETISKCMREIQRNSR